MSWKNTTAGKEFDLDDPHFTTPMSVISGLASGLCERKAAVDPTYSAANWNTTNKKSQTVSRMADNIAITHVVGGTVTYGTSAAQFVQPESWGQGTPVESKTYLDYFDNELMNVANMYVDSGGVAYNGFDELADAASARADSDTTVSHYDGYVVGTTATSGGSGVTGDADRPSYVGEFTPMFRADWAVERRDMLEELMWSIDPNTADKIDTTQASGGEYNVNHEFGMGFSFGYVSGYIDDCWYFTSETDSTRDMDFPYHEAADGVLSDGRLSHADVSAAYNLDCLVTAANGAETVNVTFYLGDSYEYHQRYADYMCESGLDVRTYVSTPVTAVEDGGYCVVNGGTLTVPDNVIAGKVTVEAGGSIIFQGGGSLVNLLFLEQGATVIPFSSNGMLHRYSFGMAWDFVDVAGDFIVGIGNTLGPGENPEDVPADEKKNYIHIADGTTTPPSYARKLYITGGANISAVDKGEVYVSGATFTTQATGECNTVLVDNGGLYIMSGAGVGNIEVLPGGITSLCSTEANTIGTLHVRSGGSAVITGTKTKIIELVVHDGAYVDIAGGVVDADWRNADGDEFIYYMNIYHYCTFGLTGKNLTNDVKPGWVEVTGHSIGDDMYRLYGVDTPAEGNTRITNYIYNYGLGNMGGRILGTVTVGTTTYSNIEAAYKYTHGDTCYVHYGAQVLAKNRRAEGGTLTNHYPEFTYRKFGNDHE